MREDLRILVMSATLDGARVAALMGDAPVVASEGRAFPVETRYVERDPNRRIEEVVADVDAAAPCERIPARCWSSCPDRRRSVVRRDILAGESIPTCELAPLYGALTPAEQDRAVAPAPAGTRKVVLATSIAETSLTIEGVRIVVDSGLARVPVYEPGLGLTRLVTARASRAPPWTSAAAGPAARSRACAGASGRRRAPAPWSRSRGPRSCRPTSPGCSSTAPPGAWPIRGAWPSSIRRRLRPWRRPAPR